MDEESYQRAADLKRAKAKVKEELNLWKNLSKGSICELDHKFRPRRIGTALPENVFENIRTSAVNSLKLELVEIENEFESL